MAGHRRSLFESEYQSLLAPAILAALIPISNIVMQLSLSLPIIYTVWCQCLTHLTL